MIERALGIGIFAVVMYGVWKLAVWGVAAYGWTFSAVWIAAMLLIAWALDRLQSRRE